MVVCLHACLYSHHCLYNGALYHTCLSSHLYRLILLVSVGYDLWWKRELNYRTPKLYLNVLLGNPLSATTVEQAAASLLFRHLMMSYLNDKIYAAKLAGFSISVTTPVGGIYIKLKGYSDKRAFGRLLDTVLDGTFDIKNAVAPMCLFKAAETIFSIPPTKLVLG